MQMNLYWALVILFNTDPICWRYQSLPMPVMAVILTIFESYFYEEVDVNTGNETIRYRNRPCINH